jgi:hypothetical protein
MSDRFEFYVVLRTDVKDESYLVFRWKWGKFRYGT